MRRTVTITALQTTAFAALLAFSGCDDTSNTVPVADTIVADASNDGATSDTAGDTAADTTTAGPLTGLECPRVDLGSAVPATYTGSTVGLPNLVTSSRLEWTDAPDDALQFTAPEKGSYVVELTGDNASMWPSASVYTGTASGKDFFEPSDCPAPGATVEIDGWLDGDAEYPWELEAGQTILIWVGVPYWAAEPTGEYTITITKQ